MPPREVARPRTPCASAPSPDRCWIPAGEARRALARRRGSGRGRARLRDRGGRWQACPAVPGRREGSSHGARAAGRAWPRANDLRQRIGSARPLRRIPFGSLDALALARPRGRCLGSRLSLLLLALPAVADRLLARPLRLGHLSLRLRHRPRFRSCADPHPAAACRRRRVRLDDLRAQLALAGTTFVACKPFAPCSGVNSTFEPSASDLKPLPPMPV